MTAHATSTNAPTKTSRGPSLWAIVAAELARLRRPSFAIVAPLTVLASVALVQLISLFETDTDLAALEAPSGHLHGLVSGSELLGLVCMGLWAAAVGADYSTGWVRHLATAEPRPGRLLAGKVMAMVLVTGALIALAVSTAMALAWPLAGPAGIDTSRWSLTQLPAIWANLTLSGAVWGSIGLSIAASTRSTIAAVTAGVAYLLVFETLLVITIPDAATHLPGAILSVLATGGSADLGYWPAIGFGAATGFASLVVANLVVAKREISD